MKNCPFLVLAVLFLVPGTIVLVARRDLRPVIAVMALLALPFALTERWFYPVYWRPPFLFDLAARIGFGIEDVLFVVGLASFTSTAYAFFTRSRYEPHNRFSPGRAVLRGVLLFGAVALGVAGALRAGLPMIYAAPAIMLIAAGGIAALRPDLLLPAVAGGALSAAVYFVLCLGFGLLLPRAFESYWNTEAFLNRFVAGVPVEELVYGFSAGAAATAAYPFLADRRLARAR